eukprot:TRINITY_DN31531_c0_g1_i1.p1 TRINITY_DN31531_c0_g1~~TRINITY_DN31531_c0_g1_i1.p1  ORF type:complete len:392 (+),score=34.15 TRINITY_DN31531_c0_g1_i1:156-1178(+)
MAVEEGMLGFYAREMTGQERTMHNAQGTACASSYVIPKSSSREFHIAEERINATLSVSNAAKRGRAAVFWHIGPPRRLTAIHWIRLIFEQITVLIACTSAIQTMFEADPEVLLSIHDTGIFSRTFINALNFWGLLPDTWRVLASAPFHESVHPAFEAGTLEHLWHYCKAASFDTYVLYLHTKTRSDWRRVMQHFVLGKAEDSVCNLRNGWDTVGALFQNLGWPHYHGNFWWAKCDYISRLPMPSYIRENDRPDSWRDGSGRFYAEAWLLRTLDMQPQRDVYVKNCWGVPRSFEKEAPTECRGFSTGSTDVMLDTSRTWASTLLEENATCRCTAPTSMQSL